MDDQIQYINWLKGLAERGGQGRVDNVDSRALGRIAKEIESLRSVVLDRDKQIEQLLEGVAQQYVKSLRLDVEEAIRVAAAAELDRDEYKRRLDIIRRWSRNFTLLGGFTVWDKFLMENLEAADWFKEV